VSDGVLTGTIGKGLCVLVGFEEADTLQDMEWMAHKLVNLRIFPDADGKLNTSVIDNGYEILVVSQFTLYASTQKGFRPSFSRAAPGPIAKLKYEQFLEVLQVKLDKPLQTGIFAADMRVSLVNDGPVTIAIDSKQKE